MPVEASEVATWLGLKTPDSTLDDVVAMVNAYVATLPIIANLDDAAEWPETAHLGGVMLAGRYYRRRNSPNGVEAITESGAQYVARYDSDISRLLGLDAYARPAIG